MTDDEILEMAKQADDMAEAKETDKEWVFDFAHLVAKRQREESAEIISRELFDSTLRRNLLNKIQGQE